MSNDVQAYIDLLSTDDDGGQVVTLVVEYSGKTAKIELGLDKAAIANEPLPEVLKREILQLMDVLEEVDASVHGILENKPERPSSVPGTGPSSAKA